MLLRFAVSNYRSIRDRQDLVLTATGLSQKSPVVLRTTSGSDLRVLPAVGIFGANGSGKSAMVESMSAMVGRIVVGPSSQTSSRPTPFLLDDASRSKPTEFIADIVVGGVEYSYGFAVDDSGIAREWLHAYPHGRRQVWFDRDARRSPSFRFPGEHLRGGAARLVDRVRADTLFLSVATAFNHEQLTSVAAWFHGVFTVPDQPPPPDMFEDAFATLFESEFAPRALALTLRADLGIRDIRVVDSPGYGQTIEFVHAGPAGEHALPVLAESSGTHAWLWLIIDLLHVLKGGGLLIVDEFGRLHPDLAAEAIRLFQDPTVNSRQGQLVFASHDPTLMGLAGGIPLLEREQIWFTEKRDGTTDLYPLAAFKPRKDENVERRYRLGHFGAVPDLSPGELGQAVHSADEPPDD